MSQPESFLPPEYIEQQRDHRTTFLAIGLFVVVVIAVLAAFLYRQGQLRQVVEVQENLITRTEEAGMKVAMLTALQQSRSQMFERAEIAAALVERVPRSILIAQMIDRMPDGLGLTEFELQSTLIRKAPTSSSKTRKRTNNRVPTRSEIDAKEKSKVVIPKYVVRMKMKGIAPTDLHVSEFLSALNKFPIMQNVRLESTREDLIDEDIVRRFEITGALKANADVRSLGSLEENMEELIKQWNETR